MKLVKFVKLMEVIEWAEIIGLNVVTISVVGWIASFLDHWTTLIAIFVGASVVALNYAKYRGIQLDNKKKELQIQNLELEEDEEGKEEV